MLERIQLSLHCQPGCKKLVAFFQGIHTLACCHTLKIGQCADKHQQVCIHQRNAAANFRKHHNLYGRAHVIQVRNGRAPHTRFCIWDGVGKSGEEPDEVGFCSVSKFNWTPNITGLQLYWCTDGYVLDFQQISPVVGLDS